MNQSTVFVHRSSTAEYPQMPPFHAESYPEYAFSSDISDSNSIYEAVRETFHLAGLDETNYGTASWNPLKGLINPGETIQTSVVKWASKPENGLSKIIQRRA